MSDVKSIDAHSTTDSLVRIYEDLANEGRKSLLDFAYQLLSENKSSVEEILSVEQIRGGSRNSPGFTT